MRGSFEALSQNPPLLGSRDGDLRRADRGSWGVILRYPNIYYYTPLPLNLANCTSQSKLHWGMMSLGKDTVRMSLTLFLATFRPRPALVVSSWTPKPIGLRFSTPKFQPPCPCGCYVPVLFARLTPTQGTLEARSSAAKSLQTEAMPVSLPTLTVCVCLQSLSTNPKPPPTPTPKNVNVGPNQLMVQALKIGFSLVNTRERK